MAKFHLNYKGEPGPCSAQDGNCPFGGAEDHFSSVTEARQAYEAAHAAFQAPAKREDRPAVAPQKPKASKGSKTTSGFWEDDRVPDPKDSKLIVPAAINDDSGYMGGRRWKGGKVPEHYLSQKAAAKLIRSDIRAAMKAGELPKNLTYSVRMATGAWVTSINVYVGGQNEAGATRELDEDEWSDHRMAKVKRYLEALGNQYSTDESNAQFDYFNSHNRVRVSAWHKYL